MADYVGSESAITLQKQLFLRRVVINGDTNLTNGGRVMHILDPETVGWERVRQYAQEDQLIGFPAVKGKEMIRHIQQHLGAHWSTPVWHCLQGEAAQVLRTCHVVVKSNGLPSGWRILALEQPDDAQIDSIQSLNAKTGVSPYPAYYMRSEALPVVTMCIHDENNQLVATASVADRYSEHSRLGGHVFAGNVSVASRCRGKGLGKLVNALALIESHKRLNWKVVTEQVSPDNPVSRAMIHACGLDDEAGLTSVLASNTGEEFTK